MTSGNVVFFYPSASPEFLGTVEKVTTDAPKMTVKGHLVSLVSPGRQNRGGDTMSGIEEGFK